jgi:hypothetical protein
MHHIGTRIAGQLRRASGGWQKNPARQRARSEVLQQRLGGITCVSAAAGAAVEHVIDLGHCVIRSRAPGGTAGLACVLHTPAVISHSMTEGRESPPPTKKARVDGGPQQAAAVPRIVPSAAHLIQLPAGLSASPSPGSVHACRIAALVRAPTACPPYSRLLRPHACCSMLPPPRPASPPPPLPPPPHVPPPPWPQDTTSTSGRPVFSSLFASGASVHWSCVGVPEGHTPAEQGKEGVLLPTRLQASASRHSRLRRGSPRSCRRRAGCFMAAAG